MECMIFNLTNKTSGFYKKNNLCLIFARDVENENLFSANKDQYVYPVNEWYWFDDIELARKEFNMIDCRVEPMYPYNDVDPLIFYPEFRPIYNIPPAQET
jgi:hypothetical protein